MERAKLGLQHIESLVSQAEQKGDKIDPLLVRRLAQLSERARKCTPGVTADIVTQPKKPSSSKSRAPDADSSTQPRPYAESLGNPGQLNTDVENARLRAEIKRLQDEKKAWQDQHDEITHLSKIIESRYWEASDGRWHARMPQFGQVPAWKSPNDTVVAPALHSKPEYADPDGSGVGERQRMRKDKTGTPVADAHYRPRAYARHEQAMAWNSTSGSIDYSLRTAVAAAGEWFHLTNMAGFMDDMVLARMVEQILTSEHWAGVCGDLSEVSPEERRAVAVAIIHLRGLGERQIVEVEREVLKPYVLERSVAVPVERRIGPEREDWSGACKEVRVPLLQECIKEVELTTRVGEICHTTETREVAKPVEVLKVCEVPVVQEVVREVCKEVYKEVPVEVIKEVPKIVEVPTIVEVVREVVRVQRVEVPVEKIVYQEVPVERIIYQDRIIYQEKVVEKEVVKPVEVVREVIKEVPVPVPMEVEVVRQMPQQITEVELTREVVVPGPVERCEVVKEVEVVTHKETKCQPCVEREKLVEVPVVREVLREIPKVRDVEVEVLKEIAVRHECPPVEVQVPRPVAVPIVKVVQVDARPSSIYQRTAGGYKVWHHERNDINEELFRGIIDRSTPAAKRRMAELGLHEPSAAAARAKRPGVPVGVPAPVATGWGRWTESHRREIYGPVGDGRGQRHIPLSSLEPEMATYTSGVTPTAVGPPDESNLRGMWELDKRQVEKQWGPHSFGGAAPTPPYPTDMTLMDEQDHFGQRGHAHATAGGYTPPIPLAPAVIPSGVGVVGENPALARLHRDALVEATQRLHAEYAEKNREYQRPGTYVPDLGKPPPEPTPPAAFGDPPASAAALPAATPNE